MYTVMVFLRVVAVARGRCYSKDHLQGCTLVNYDHARGGIKVTCSLSAPYHHYNASSLKAMPACINRAHWKGQAGNDKTAPWRTLKSSQTQTGPLQPHFQTQQRGKHSSGGATTASAAGTERAL